MKLSIAIATLEALAVVSNGVTLSKVHGTDKSVEGEIHTENLTGNTQGCFWQEDGGCIPLMPGIVMPKQFNFAQTSQMNLFDPCARMGPIGALTLESAYLEAVRYSNCAGTPPPNPSDYRLPSGGLSGLFD